MATSFWGALFFNSNSIEKLTSLEIRQSSFIILVLQKTSYYMNDIEIFLKLSMQSLLYTSYINIR